MSYNYFHGSLPKEIGNLTHLEQLGLTDCNLSYSLPAEIGNLKHLHSLSVDLNHFTGALPSSLGNLTSLELFFGENNQFFSTFPANFANNETDSIFWVALSDNLLTGTLPESISYWKNLKSLEFARNSFFGNLPSEFNRFFKLEGIQLNQNFFYGDNIYSLFADNPLLYLYNIGDNQFSGPLPASDHWSSSLLYYLTFKNYFTETIPSFLENCFALYYFESSSNYLTSTIPSYLHSSMVLSYLNLTENLLTGPYVYNTSNMNSVMNALEALSLSFNFLTGTIPKELGSLTNLQDIILNNNEFTGTIPESLQLLKEIRILFLQNNQLTGPLFHQSIKISTLTSLDVSNNQLTGSLPDIDSISPSLQTFAASSNCLSGSISATFCNLTALEFIALNGLSSASACRSPFFPGSYYLNAFYVKKLLSYQIPDCLFVMPHLQTLLLSGNGLTGSLPQNINISAPLTDLTLSYNSLTGTLPLIFQERAWNNLDVSYNRLTGTLSESFHTMDDDASLTLDINRFSGGIPSVLFSAKTIDILEGNIFSCNLQRNDLPVNDDRADDYSCGSDIVNATIISWSVIFGIILFGSLGIFVAYNEQFTMKNSSVSDPKLTDNDQNLQKSSENHITNSVTTATSTTTTFVDYLSQIYAYYSYFHSINETTKVPTSYLAGLEMYLQTIRRLTFFFIFCIFFLLLPVYISLSVYYHIYYYSYAWIFSGLFLSGVTPGIILILSLILLLIVFIYFFEYQTKRRIIRYYKQIKANRRIFYYAAATGTTTTMMSFMNSPDSKNDNRYGVPMISNDFSSRNSSMSSNYQQNTSITPMDSNYVNSLTTFLRNFNPMHNSSNNDVVENNNNNNTVISPTSSTPSLDEEMVESPSKDPRNEIDNEANNDNISQDHLESPEQVNRDSERTDTQPIPKKKNIFIRLFTSEPFVLFIIYLLISFVDCLIMVLADILYVYILLTYSTTVIIIAEFFLAIFKLVLNNQLVWFAIPFLRKNYYFYLFPQQGDAEEEGNGDENNYTTNRFSILSELDHGSFHYFTHYHYSSLDISFITIVIILNNIFFPILAIFIVSPECFYNALFAAPAITSFYNYVICQRANILVPDVCFSTVTLSESSSFSPPFIYDFECFSVAIINYVPVFIIMFTFEGIINPVMKLLIKWFSVYLEERERRKNGGADNNNRTTIVLSTTVNQLNQFPSNHITAAISNSKEEEKEENKDEQDEQEEQPRDDCIVIQEDQPVDSETGMTVKQTELSTLEGGSFRPSQKTGSVTVKRRSTFGNKKKSFLLSLLLHLTPDSLKDLTPFSPIKDTSTQKHYVIFNKNRLSVRINSYLIVMMSFGALFPPLALIICVSIIIVTIYEEIVIGRLLMESERLGFSWYRKQLEKDCYGMGDTLKYTLWSLVPVSSLVYAHIIFDTWGDETGWKRAVLPAALVCVVPILLLVKMANYERVKKWWDKRQKGNSKQRVVSSNQSGIEALSVLSGFAQRGSASRGGRQFSTDSSTNSKSDRFELFSDSGNNR
jgi:hypothetical protein